MLFNNEMIKWLTIELNRWVDEWKNRYRQRHDAIVRMVFIDVWFTQGNKVYMYMYTSI